MYDVIQHLHGSTDDWKKHDIIIPNAEIAIEDFSDGSRKGKVGDGVHKWSQLGYAFEPLIPGSFNDWKMLWNMVCDGTSPVYTFTTDSEGKPINYSEIYYEIKCPSAHATSSTTIYFNSSLTSYLIESTMPSTTALAHAFHLDAQRERVYRAKGVSGTSIPLYISKIINDSGAPLDNFTYISMSNIDGINYTEGTEIRMWGR